MSARRELRGIAQHLSRTARATVNDRSIPVDVRTAVFNSLNDAVGSIASAADHLSEWELAKAVSRPICICYPRRFATEDGHALNCPASRADGGGA